MNGELSFNGYRVLVLQDEHSGGLLYESKSILTPLNCILRNGQDGKFCYVFYTTILKSTDMNNISYENGDILTRKTKIILR